MKIYIDINYPKRIIDILETAHGLQKEKKYEIVRWGNTHINQSDLDNSIFLVVDYSKKNLSIPVLKQAEQGYKTFVIRITETKIDPFEYLMTVLRVWPYIIEKANTEKQIYTFRYGGRKITEYKMIGQVG